MNVIFTYKWAETYSWVTLGSCGATFLLFGHLKVKDFMTYF